MVNAYLLPIFEVDRSTITLLLLIVGAATWVVRDKLSSILALVLMAPLAFAISLVVYAGLLQLGMFNLKNMGEWLMWTICAGMVGTTVVLGAGAVLASMADRKDARIAAR
jgi:hypothetical protein